MTSKQQKNWTQGCSNKLAQILLGFDVAASTAPGLNEGKCHHIQCQTNCHVEIHPPRTRLAIATGKFGNWNMSLELSQVSCVQPIFMPTKPPKKTGKQHESVTLCRCVGLRCEPKQCSHVLTTMKTITNTICKTKNTVLCLHPLKTSKHQKTLTDNCQFSQVAVLLAV